jgi:hypothetical protein
MKLKDLGEIKVGSVVDRITDEKGTLFQVLTLKSVDNNGFFTNDFNVVKITQKSIPKLALAQRGDIIFKMTAPYRTYVVDESLEGMVVSSHYGHFKVDEQYDPYYVVIVLNDVIERFKKIDNIRIISRISVGNISNELIQLDKEDKQHLKANLMKNLIKLKTLNLELEKQNEIYQQYVINKLKGSNNE